MALGESTSSNRQPVIAENKSPNVAKLIDSARVNGEWEGKERKIRDEPGG